MGGRRGAVAASSSLTTVPHPITQGLNERHTALRSLERLREEMVKLWIELHASNGESVCWYTRGTAQAHGDVSSNVR